MKTLTSMSELIAEGFPKKIVLEVVHSYANSNGSIAFKTSDGANAKWRIWREKFIKEVERRAKCGK